MLRIRSSVLLPLLFALTSGIPVSMAGCDDTAGGGPVDAATTGSSCPGQVLDPAGAACCVDDRACESQGETIGGPVVSVSLESLCAATACPSTLDAALADTRCASALRGCGTVTVSLFGTGTFGAPSLTYDATTGALVGASVLTNELFTRKLDGCCGAAFHAGTTSTCAANEAVACTP